ncbi:hypothetical protein DB346_17510 [Verrucomicrobia bacterium LW23]|nr:hypothetical protein DB346_17510 [Verrucomicrobia bacterium LW23]
MKKYYYQDSQGQAAGPVPYEALVDMHKRGLIHSDINVLEEGTQDWKPYRAHLFPGGTVGAYDAQPGGPIPHRSGGGGCGWWPWLLGLGCLAVIGAGMAVMMASCGGLFYAGYALLDGRTKSVVDHVRTLPDAQRELGSDITYSFPSKSNLDNDTFTATFDIKGSKGSGTIDVVQHQADGENYTYTKLILRVNGKSIDLQGGGGGGGYNNNSGSGGFKLKSDKGSSTSSGTDDDSGGDGGLKLKR